MISEPRVDNRQVISKLGKGVIILDSGFEHWDLKWPELSWSVFSLECAPSCMGISFCLSFGEGSIPVSIFRLQDKGGLKVKQIKVKGHDNVHMCAWSIISYRHLGALVESWLLFAVTVSLYLVWLPASWSQWISWWKNTLVKAPYPRVLSRISNENARAISWMISQRKCPPVFTSKVKA